MIDPRKLRVGVLFGGRSGEHEVSVASAASVLRALDRNKYDVVPIGIMPDGRWISSPEALARLMERRGGGEEEQFLVPEPNRRGLVPASGSTGDHLPLDVVFPVLHGTFGEDGTVQGLFELADIPYVGAGVLGSALGLDKIIQKQLFPQAGLPVARSVWYRAPQAPGYRAVQCESCHGPGFEHVGAPGVTPFPLAKVAEEIYTDAGISCGDCHAGSHHPFVEEWAQSRHAEALATPATRADCNYCHEARAVLKAWNVQSHYVESGDVVTAANAIVITCARVPRPARLAQPRQSAVAARDARPLAEPLHAVPSPAHRARRRQLAGQHAARAAGCRTGFIVSGINCITIEITEEGVQLTPTPVPEPATMLLLGSAFLGLAGYGRRKFFQK